MTTREWFEFYNELTKEELLKAKELIDAEEAHEIGLASEERIKALEIAIVNKA